MRKDTHRILRPDCDDAWPGKQVMPFLTIFFAALAIMCEIGTGFPLVAIFFQVLADLCWWLTLIGLIYTLYQYRQWIFYWLSTNEYRCLFSPKMNQWLFNRRVYSVENQKYCIVPAIEIGNGSFQIKVLPGTLKVLMSADFVTELETVMNQNGCHVTLLPAERREGFVVYRIHPNIRKDRLYYE